MPIKVSCPSCQAAFKAPDNAAGKTAKCPQCGGAIKIPFPEPEPILDAEVEPEWGFDDDDFDVEPPAEVPAADGRKPCPMCGEMIAAEAVKCRYCGEVLDPALKKKMKKKSRVAAGDEDLTAGEWVFAIICSGIACILGIVWMIQGKPKGSKMVVVAICANVVWTVIRVMIELASQNQP